MNIILFGPQGSGKGTQARILTDKFGFFYFESGAYLRRMAEKNETLKKMLNSGLLVPDLEMTSYLTAYLDQKNLYDNIIFDGFPRTLEQYTFLKNWLTDKEVKIDLVLVLHISDEESVRRLSARRQDPTSGAIYNLITDPPPKDVDEKTLIHRDDDKPAAIKNRLNIYHTRTQMLLDVLSKEARVEKVNGESPIAEIATNIENIIFKVKNDST